MFNYHTHTSRCKHATGTDREYVESAIKSGIKVLGFSDHAPYIFPNGYRSTFRMENDEICEYAQSIRALKKEYASDIEILLGFELEYYPKFHSDEMSFLNTVKPDYLILSQHFIDNQIDNNVHVYNVNHDILEKYVSQIIQGLETGDFAFVGHPDIINCSNVSKKEYEIQFTRLCEYAKNSGYPLELNLLGIREKRPYPGEEFFKIAGQVGCDIVLGFDAHSPQSFMDKYQLEMANQLINKCNLNVITEPFIKEK